MGWDSHLISILFGVKIPDYDTIRVIQIFYPEVTEIKRPLKIPGTNYHLIDTDAGLFISLISPRFGVDEDDQPEPYYEIIPPSIVQVEDFTAFLKGHDIDYPYSQYLII
jgi:hypothetical protein